MKTSSDSALASLLLTSHLVKGAASPLSAGEYWKLIETVDDPASLLGLGGDDVAAATGAAPAEADRIAALLESATVLAVELDRLQQTGIRVLSPFDDSFPSRLVERLGHSAPPLLYVAGPAALLESDGIGIVGSRNVGAEARDVAVEAARVAAQHGLPVVSGLARGIDQTAMGAALEAGGAVVGIPADSLDKLVRDPSIRRAILAENLCVATPYRPSSGFSVGAAMGRNKIIYALSRTTLVVTADEGTGGTWNGAVEAMQKRIAPVAVWTGPGAGQGNAALVRRGGIAVDSVDALLDVTREDLAEPASRVRETQMHLEI